ncbi:hypothetical protein [Streptomyces orinoci]|uniref:Uncharacterized protein n=1 Tax=Streptomyces orinoci TaxID=67339 RepID=A0ABV3K4S5_STRON|nr:hypothetical protein [Streptomyces orinoci]
MTAREPPAVLLMDINGSGDKDARGAGHLDGPVGEEHREAQPAVWQRRLEGSNGLHFNDGGLPSL